MAKPRSSSARADGEARPSNAQGGHLELPPHPAPPSLDNTLVPPEAEGDVYPQHPGPGDAPSQQITNGEKLDQLLDLVQAMEQRLGAVEGLRDPIVQLATAPCPLPQTHLNLAPEGEDPEAHASVNSAPRAHGGDDPRPTADPCDDQAHVYRRLEDVERRQQALELQCQAGPREERAGPKGNHVLTPNPFSSGVIATPVPLRFKMSNFRPYNGTTDPSEHLQNYEMLMTLQGAPDSMKCLGFPITLEGPARAWFNTLTPASVTSFPQLGECFKAYFVSAKKPEKNSASLLSIRQTSSESLKDYVAQFHGEALLIPRLEHAVAVAALTQGTRDVSLKRALILDEPKNLTDLITQAHHYAHCNEVLRSI
uniref:Plastid 30S ribosomal protein S12 n=1 Tax=Anthurium amnicola TaxID=1678845 RepID=A0A1D1Y9S8_9ARAE